jgi:arsenate reductase
MSLLFPEIENVIRSFNFKTITDERKHILLPLLVYVQDRVNTLQEIRLNFICTHNSRRSHLAQVWAQTAAAHFDIKNVSCYSGGTEATALFPVVAKTLEESGFKTEAISEGKNPVYSIKFASDEHPIIGFSKSFDASFNPVSKFAAIMTCSQADGDCPFIAGAEKRIPITYDDPKAFDNTPLQLEKYQESSLQIATEMFYVFSQISK